MRSLIGILVLAIAGCTAGPDTPVGTDDTPQPSAPITSPVLVVTDDAPQGGGGIGVAEALEHQPTDDIVLVTGALFVDADGTIRLCEAIAESFPPQCGGARLLVEGLDLAGVEGLQTGGDVSWAEAVTLIGSVE